MPNTRIGFGYTGKPNTCLWCGRPLKPYYWKHEERFVEAGTDEYLQVTVTLAKKREQYHNDSELYGRSYTDRYYGRNLNKYKGWQPLWYTAPTASPPATVSPEM